MKSPKPQINFFINGNIQIGFGHVARSLVLAKEFQNLGFIVNFIVPQSFIFLDKIDVHGFNIYRVDSFNNKEKINHILSKNASNICVIDCIEEDFNKLKFLSENKSNFIATITLFLFDIKTRFENISFFPDFEEDNLKIVETINKTPCTIFSGRSYFTFRKEFHNITDKIIKQIGNNLLITMGGTDPHNFTLQVLQSIRNIDDFNITVILNKNADSFEDVKNICHKFNIKLLNHVNNIAILMKNADIIILNGGTTRYEACITKTPFIAISIHDIQYNITKKVTDKVGAINLGVGELLTNTAINNAINEISNDYELRRSISQRMKNIFDIDGAESMCKVILKEYIKQ